MLGRGWGTVAEAEPSITMYVVWHHFRLGIVPQLVFFFSSLKPEMHQEGKMQVCL